MFNGFDHIDETKINRNFLIMLRLMLRQITNFVRDFTGMDKKILDFEYKKSVLHQGFDD